MIWSMKILISPCYSVGGAAFFEKLQKIGHFTMFFKFTQIYTHLFYKFTLNTVYDTLVTITYCLQIEIM